MSQQDLAGGVPGDPTVPPTQKPGSPAPKRRKRGGLILKIIASLLVVIILLVLLAPTIISSGPVISTALGVVNKQLNGKVEVSSVSLGWFSGIKIDGVRVFDASGTQIAELDHATVPYPLIKALSGSKAFGQIVIDGFSADAKTDSNGQLNFAQLVKSSPTSPSTPAPTSSTPTGDTKPSKLPAISLDLKLTNCHGTFSQPGKPTVYLTRLDGDVNIPDINQPITNNINAGIKVGDGAEGTVSLAGTTAAVKDYLVAIDSAAVHQTIDVQNLDLAAAQPFMPASPGVSTLEGVMSLHLTADATDGKNAALDVQVTNSKPIAFGGKVLQGDTFSTSTFTAAIPKLTAVFPDGFDKWQSGRIKVGTETGSAPISLKVDQGNVTAIVDLVPQAILNASDKKSPGSDGQLAVTSSFDLAKIIPQLRHTVPQAEGVLIQSAGFSENLKLTITPEQLQLTNSADSTAFVGTQKLANGQTRAIALGAIHLNVSANDLGGGGVLPNVHNISLKLDSPFATGNFQGESLSDLKGNLNANLQTLQTQLSQFVDFGKMNLGGDLQVDVSGTGQLTAAPYKASLKATVAMHNFKYGDQTGQRVNEPLVQLVAAADLQGSATSTVESARSVVVTLKVGEADAPTVDVLAEVPSIALTGSPSGDFKLSHFRVDLARMQKELAAIPAGQAGMLVNQGTLTISSAGKFAAHSASLDSLSLVGDNLFLSRQLANGQQVTAVAGEKLTLNLSATAQQTPAADGKTSDTAVVVKTFTLTDAGQILDVHKSGGDFVLTLAGNGGVGGKGQLDLAMQLGSLNDIAKKLAQTEVTVKTVAGNVQSGTLAGTLSLVTTAPGKSDVNADLKLNDLVVTTDTGTLPAQSAVLSLRATADQNASTIAIDQAGIQSNLATATISKAMVSLAAKSRLDQVQTAHWQVDVPDLKPVMELANAFSPPVTPAPATAAPTAAKSDASSNKSIPPMKITSGVISMNGDISHDAGTLKINVNDVTANNVAFTRGDIQYTARPVDLKLLISILSGDGKTLMDQIQQVQVTQLTGDLGVATLSMPTPISIAQLSTTPVASGGIQLVGNLTDLTLLLSALQGEKPSAYPYGGDYTLTENISTKKQTVGLKGGIQIAKFHVYNGKTVSFSENLLALANDVSLTTGEDESVNITALSANMQSSGAMNVSVNPGSNIAHLQSTRDMLLQVKANYDLAKLWPIVQPMMGDSYKTLKVTGQYQKQFNVSGRYPAGLPSTEAIKTLHADGDLAVATFDYDGLGLQNFIVPFTMDNGQFVTVYTGKPAGQNTAPPAAANGGTLDLSNLTIDLTQDPPRLTTPPKKAIITQVTINPIFAGSVLEKLINNPLFAGGKTGLIDLTLDDCTNLPLGNLVTLSSPDNKGKADIRFSMTQLNVGLGTDALSSILKQTSFESDIKDATVSVAKGISTQHIHFSTGQYVLSFDGQVRLKDQAFIPMTLGFPLAAIAAKTHMAGGKSSQYLPDQVQIPVEGTVSNPKYRFDKVIPKALADAAAKALTHGLLGGGKDNGGGDNPLGGLLNKLQKNGQ